MENQCFGSKYLMIWADYSDEINLLYFKTFISNPSDEDENYRTYKIEEGYSDLTSDGMLKITKSYPFKKMKVIQNLFQYFTEDILVQVNLQNRADILEFLRDYNNDAFREKETNEELGISY